MWKMEIEERKENKRKKERARERERKGREGIKEKRMTEKKIEI